MLHSMDTQQCMHVGFGADLTDLARRLVTTWPECRTTSEPNGDAPQEQLWGASLLGFVYLHFPINMNIYKGELQGLYVLLSRTQAGPGRAIKQQQEENSRNHVKAFSESLYICQIGENAYQRIFNTVLISGFRISISTTSGIPLYVVLKK